LRLLYFKTGERIQIKSLLRRDKQKKQKNASFKAVNCVIFLRLVFMRRMITLMFSPDEKDVRQH